MMRRDVKALTTFFDCIRKQSGKLWQTESEQAVKELMEWQQCMDLGQVSVPNVPHIGHVTKQNMSRVPTAPPLRALKWSMWKSQSAPCCMDTYPPAWPLHTSPPPVT